MAAHKRVHWRRPAGGKRRPPVLDVIRTELVRQIEGRCGAFWLKIAPSLRIAGYPLARALDRVRAFRSDGAESALAMLTTLLYTADVRTGFIGRPRPGFTHWQRFTVRDLAQFAYGGQTEGDQKRAGRALAVLRSMGFLSHTRQVRRNVAERDAPVFLSEPGVRRLDLDRIAKVTGTYWLLKRARIALDRDKGTARLDNPAPASGHGAGAVPAQAGGTRPPSTAGPPPSGTVLEQMQAMVRWLEDPTQPPPGAVPSP